MLKHLCIPRRKKRTLFLLGLSFTTATLMAVSIVTNLQLPSMGNLDNSYARHQIVNGYPAQNDVYLRGVQKMNIVRETLAVEDDYPEGKDFSAMNPDTNIAGGKKIIHSGKILQAVFNYQRSNNIDEYAMNKEGNVVENNNLNDDVNYQHGLEEGRNFDDVNSDKNSLRGRDLIVSDSNINFNKNSLRRNSTDLALSNSSIKNPLVKSTDENGNVVFHIQNTSHHSNAKKNVSSTNLHDSNSKKNILKSINNDKKFKSYLVKFNKDRVGFKVLTDRDTLSHNNNNNIDHSNDNEDQDYSYQYNQNPVFKENDFDEWPRNDSNLNSIIKQARNRTSIVNSDSVVNKNTNDINSDDIEQHFIPQQKTNLFKFLFNNNNGKTVQKQQTRNASIPNSVSASITRGNDTVKMSNNTISELKLQRKANNLDYLVFETHDEKYRDKKLSELQHKNARNDENWQNSRRKGVGISNELSSKKRYSQLVLEANKKHSQFVLEANNKHSQFVLESDARVNRVVVEKNVASKTESARGNNIAVKDDSSFLNSRKQNLLPGNAVNDHNKIVKLSQPCGPSDTDCNINNEVSKQASNNLHYQKLSAPYYEDQVDDHLISKPVKDHIDPLFNQAQNSVLSEVEWIASLEHNKHLDNNDQNNKQPLIATINKQLQGDSSLVNSNIRKHSIDTNQHQVLQSSQLENEEKFKSASNNFQNQDSKIETQIPIQNGIGSLVDLDFPATQLQHPGIQNYQVSVRNREGMPLVVDKIYWSQEALDLVPEGLTEEDFKAFLTNVSHQRIGRFEAPTWRRCGRPKNRYAVLEGGQQMCARYREGHNKMVQGELLSFYLSRFLGIDNIPAVVLAEVDSNATQWELVKEELVPAQWRPNTIVGFIMWVDNLETSNGYGKAATKMPEIILNAYENNSTVTYKNKLLSTLTAYQLADIVQWTDMILFDYITGNYDRVASMQDGAQREENPNIMHEDMRNLRKNWRTGKLWFIDNESGLLDAYQLIYNYNHPSQFYKFHYQMLSKICIFNRKTVNNIKKLVQEPEPYKVLVKYAKMQEPLYNKLVPSNEAYNLFQTKFHTRLKEIIDWVTKCQHSL